jgi:predicted esterase
MCCTILLAALAALPAWAQDVAQDTVFSAYSPLSGNSEMMRRLYSPLRARRIEEELRSSGKTLGDQAIDLAQEKFVVAVPAQKPAKGYGLIVFVPPWNSAKAPVGWLPVLDRAGFIFVSAANSGNDQDVAARREPLALLAEQNVAARYDVDPRRIYVAGFSGGSRVALRLALGYPDIFDGALLNAGSDPIGSAEIPLPPADLFTHFQQSSRIVYVTGERDGFHRGMDRASIHAMSDWCVGHVDDVTAPGEGHDPADPSSLARALDRLDRTDAPDPLDDCMAKIKQTLAAQLQLVQSLEVAGKHDEAQARLKEIDDHYGGLAAPQSLALVP